MTLVFDWIEKWQANENLYASLCSMRDIVLAMDDEITETIKWNVPYYSYKGHLGYLSVMNKKTPYFSFAHGAFLDDIEGILTGQHKKIVRYFEVDPTADIDIDKFQRILEVALSYNRANPNIKFQINRKK